LPFNIENDLPVEQGDQGVRVVGFSLLNIFTAAVKVIYTQ